MRPAKRNHIVVPGIDAGENSRRSANEGFTLMARGESIRSVVVY